MIKKQEKHSQNLYKLVINLVLILLDYLIKLFMINIIYETNIIVNTGKQRIANIYYTYVKNNLVMKR